METEPESSTGTSRSVQGEIPYWARVQKVFLAIIVVLSVLVLVFGGLAVKDSVIFLRDTRDLQALIKVHHVLDHLMINVLKAESGQRGFLLTGQRAYLLPYLEANGEIGRDLARIRDLDCKDPVFQAEMPVVAALIRAKRDELARTIRLEEEKGPRAAIPVVRSNFGITMMRLIQFHVANIERSIQQGIQRFRIKSEDQKRASFRHAGIFVPVFILILITGSVYLRRQYRVLRQLSLKLEREATHDSLTGLPNRKFFYESMKLTLGRLERGTNSCAVLYLDLDRFKEVNDLFGHQAGDRVLVEFSKRLMGLTRKGDLVARLGGDEFSIVLDPVEDPGLVSEIARKFGERLTETPLIPEIDISDVGVSIGWSIAPKDGTSPDILIAKADKAMYLMKESHRGKGKSSIG